MNDESPPPHQDLLSSLAAEQAGLRRRVKRLRLAESAATIGGLLTEPRLQRHGVRLEALAHFVVDAASGPSAFAHASLCDAFDALGEGQCAYLEDPPGNLFVDLVHTSRGHFRVLPGTWEASAFLLQRTMNLVQRLPEAPGYREIRDSCFALLRLSEVICERAGLSRYSVGDRSGVDHLPDDLAHSADALRDRVEFPIDELSALGIDPDALAHFVLTPADRKAVLDADFGATSLERRPLIYDDGRLYLALPTAVSPAIRRFAFETLGTGELTHAFPRALAEEYSAFLSTTRLLGGMTASGVRFQKTAGAFVAAMCTGVDVGRYLQFVFVVDDLTAFEQTAFAEPNPDPTAAAPAIDWAIGEGVRVMTERPDFVSGVVLVVGCGFGRPVVNLFDGVDDPRIQFETVSAADLETLSWVRGFKPLTLFRLLDAQKAMKRQGAELFNPQGLLNLVGWVRSLDGHLAPHGEIEDGMVGDGTLMIMVEPTAGFALREEVAREWDAHTATDVDGRTVPVRREGLTLFASDAEIPLYASEEPPPRGLYETARRTWWVRTAMPDGLDGDLAYARWKVAHVWLGRAAPVLEEAFPGLADGPIEWVADFGGSLERHVPDFEAIDFDAARAAIEVTADPVGRILTTRTSTVWERAHAQPENVAERALVDALVTAAARLADDDLTAGERNALVWRIVRSPQARQQHAFRVPGDRDLFGRGFREPVVVIEREDDAAARLGLGWIARSREEPPVLRGKADCTAYLNTLVKCLEDELLTALAPFNRKAALTAILENHEGAARETAHWKRTSAAVMALHEDDPSVGTVILEREAKMNAVALATRMLAEFALCACPLEGGREPGDLDLARLMSLAVLIFHTGGDSDAIQWDVMEPVIRITPLGDVHANREFGDEVVEAFAKVAAGVRLKTAIDTYAENVVRPKASEPEAPDDGDQVFDRAIEEAFGAPRDDLRLLLDHLDALALEADSAVVSAPMSRLRPASRNDPAMTNLIEGLVFHPRADWRSIPEGFEAQDIQAWRFRRRLSILRRPLLRIDDAPDPMILFAPAQVREAAVYMLGNYRRGDFRDSQLGPLMANWKKSIADRRGRAFSKEVAQKLSAAGWKTETEVKVTKIFDRRLDRDYGDVDVLAWDPESGRMLIIECKDVQYRKTFGEVAEQLSDFRGVVGPKGKPDLLLKHLTRVELLSAKPEIVSAYVGIAKPSIESHLVFRNPVPMKFALAHLEARMTLSTFDELSELHR